MSSVTVTLPPDTERKLREKAVSAGLSLETYLSRLAEADATNGTPSTRRPSTKSLLRFGRGSQKVE